MALGTIIFFVPVLSNTRRTGQIIKDSQNRFIYSDISLLMFCDSAFDDSLDVYIFYFTYFIYVYISFFSSTFF